jgi:hypothetical protein
LTLMCARWRRTERSWTPDAQIIAPREPILSGPRGTGCTLASMTDMGALARMPVVETIAKIRRAHFVQSCAGTGGSSASTPARGSVLCTTRATRSRVPLACRSCVPFQCRLTGREAFGKSDATESRRARRSARSPTLVRSDTEKRDLPGKASRGRT